MLIWTGMAMNSHTELRVFPGVSVTCVRYRDGILHLHVRPFLAAMGSDTLFMDDNARPHHC